MNAAILTSIVGALSALLGVALTAYVQLRNQRSNQQFQLAVETAKYERDSADREKIESLRRMAEAHKALSAIAREFSVTTLDILWRSSMTDSEYDQRYLAASSNMDDLRAFAGLHESSLIDDIEKLHSQMNIFWGSFKNVLYQTSQGQKVDHTSSSLTNAHDAANEIGRVVFFVKGRLTQLASSVRSDG
ncbi:hypothetical protein [[Pseudomonas] boreopolis]|uniref:hypothetical protein n=1 Tax=Xanthomonas boreopolis TaxID=86183 RepID=UPI003DA01ADC